MQTTLLNTVTLSEFTDLVEKSFITYNKKVTPASQELFINQDMAAHTGESKRFDEVDTETFGKLKRQGMKAQKANVGVGYNKTMTVKRIAREIDITFEHRRYNKFPEVTGLLTSLNEFGPQRAELDRTHRFTFAGASSMVDMDGDTVDLTAGDSLPIVYATHTLKFSSSTWRNRVSSDPDFGKAALESAEGLFNTDILSNFGERRVMTPNVIITGDDPNTVNDVKQFLNSTTEVGQSNSGVINVYKSKYRHIQLPYLATTALGANDSSKAKYWFLASIGQSVNGLQAYYGVWEPAHMQSPPNEGNNGEDRSTDNWTYGTRMSYGMCFVSARGLVGSLAS